MSTLADVINDVQNHLYSHMQIRDNVTSLDGALDDSALSFSVDEPEVVRKGFVEIDDELIEVKSSSSASGVTVYPWGRGERGTTAAAHSDGAKVTVNPLYPRSLIKSAVNETVTALYPMLWETVTADLGPYSVSDLSYALPAACEDVISVSYEVQSSGGLRRPITRFQMVRDTTDAPFLELYQPARSGENFRVVYKRIPTGFTTEATTFSAAGLKEQWRDLIRYGVLYKLLVSGEGQRLQMQSAEASARNATAQPFQAMSVSKHYLSLYRARLEEERRLLLNEYPATVVRLT